MELVLSWPPSPGHRAWRGVCQYTYRDSSRENYLLPCQWVSTGHSFLVRCGSHAHFPLSVPGPHLCRPNTHCHGICEFIYASGLLCMKTLSPCRHLSRLALTIFPPPLPHIPWALEGFDKDIPFEDKCSKVSHSLHIVQLWVCLVPIYCKKQLLWWWLSGTDLWV